MNLKLDRRRIAIKQSLDQFTTEQLKVLVGKLDSGHVLCDNGWYDVATGHW
jgi:hypothetical protein